MDTVSLYQKGLTNQLQTSLRYSSILNELLRNEEKSKNKTQRAERESPHNSPNSGCLTAEIPQANPRFTSKQTNKWGALAFLQLCG